MDSVDDLPALSPPSCNTKLGLNYGQAMDWLCHLTLRHWNEAASYQPGSLTMERLTNLFNDMDNLERALGGHLRSREACHSIQAVKEFYSLELHRNFIISTLCRPILSKDGQQSLTQTQVDMVLGRLQLALKRSVKAFIRLRAVTCLATRSWAFVHNGLTSALLLSFMKETRNEDDSRQIQDELIKSLTEGDVDFPASDSESASGGIFATQMTNAHKKSLKALKLLRKFSDEERRQKDRSGDIDGGNTRAFSSTNTLSEDAMNAIHDPGSVECVPGVRYQDLTHQLCRSAEFDELLRAFDFSSTLPLEAFEYITSDPLTPAASFEAFNWI